MVELGKIIGVWGVRGWVKVHSYTRERLDIAKYSCWHLGESGAIAVEQCRQQGRGIVAKLAGVNSREAAEALIHQQIFVEQSQLPELPAGEYYWHQLINLRVKTLDGVNIGSIGSIIETGANDVLVIRPNDDSTPDILIPYVDEVVVRVDLQECEMQVDWDPAYLLD